MLVWAHILLRWRHDDTEATPAEVISHLLPSRTLVWRGTRKLTGLEAQCRQLAWEERVVNVPGRYRFPGGSGSELPMQGMLVPSLVEELRSHMSGVGGGHGNPLQYSYLENPKDRGAWWAPVHGATESWTQLSDLAHISILAKRWKFLGKNKQ